MPIQSDGSLHRMQEEALRRMREMQNRAAPPAQEAPAPPAAEKQPAAPQVAPAQPAQAAPPASGGLDLLLRNKDYTIILALLLILGAEPGGTSPDLLLALLFLLM